MCGRYTNTRGAPELEREFKAINRLENSTPRYNIAPTQLAPVVIQIKERVLENMRWGIIPIWARNSNSPIINARAESLMEKPTFKKAFLHQRCLIPADGFYEWIKQSKPKQPVRFLMEPEHLFAFAGIWAPTENTSSSHACFAIITTNANNLVKPVHDRMPAIIRVDDYDQWLDTEGSHEALLSLLQPYPATSMRSYSVNPCVNSTTYDSAECIKPYQPPIQGLLF